MLSELMQKVFERHGSEGSNDLDTLRPIRPYTCYRDGMHDYGKFITLWYEQRLPDGTFTSRIVRVDREHN